MKRTLLLAAAMCVLCAASCGRYHYETVKGDPMETKMYTLKNGLKVYMTVNKETPRIQTYIAVRTGGKNDPSDNTGLAHYLEHIMFKGTEQVGTTDYAKEKPMLDEIQSLYDLYRTKTDPAEREAVYHLIDSVSYEASKLAIPNEYDKLMNMIGAQGSNAFTSNDVTCYQEDIPSNQIENWAKVQSDRFKNMVVRGFHTELEAVYEELNRGLNDDSEKAMIAIDSVFFKNHPYGLQTVIGTQDHLKNPSITAIKKQKATYYVPNNCAICVSGDFNPDEFVAIVEKYFGDWKPNPELPAFTFAPEQPITAPVEKDVYGTEAEFVLLGWRYPGAADFRSDLAALAGSILYNGMAGLIDLDINQQQKVLGAYCFNYGRADYGEMLLQAYPKDGQSLTEVRDLLLGEVAKLRAGDFDDKLIDAAISNFKLREMRTLQQNRGRAMKFVDAFVNGTSWKDEVNRIDRLSKITKEDIVAWSNEFLGANSYALAYKHIGVDPSIKKIEAPKITPIVTNRDKQSAFLQEIQASEVKPIEPVFVDYEKDMSVFTADGIEVLYKQNTANDIAEWTFQVDRGLLSDPALAMAFNYVGYLGTPTRSASEIAKEMYMLGCNFGMSVSDGRTFVHLTGLSENMGKALDIVEDLIANAQPDEAVLQGLKNDIFKERHDDMFNQNACASALQEYVLFGADYVRNTTMTNAQVASVTSDELLSKVRGIFRYAHRVLYYGPETTSQFKTTLSAHHQVAAQLEPTTYLHARTVLTEKPAVYVAQYDSRQFNYVQFSNRGEKFDVSEDAKINLFNQYFGAGMNTIVFQEMREARALAYHASASLDEPTFLDDDYTFSAEIGSQNDKLQKSVEAFDLIINDMPQSEKSFEIAKSGLESKLRTNRVTGSRVLSSYLAARELGLKEPRSKQVYKELPSLTLNDLVATQQKWVKDRTYVYAILGDTRDMDMQFLSTLGPVKVVGLEEIFGY